MNILVTAEHFGYGPIATALNVVKELKKYSDVKLTFMGTGIALEQAIMSKYFDEIIECKTFDIHELEKFKDKILSFDIVLSSENQPGAKFAIIHGHKRVYFIDNLMWMWDKLDSGLEEAKGYIISEIISSKENFERIGKNIKNPIFTGPLREIDINKPLTKENKLIINTGGAEAFVIDSEIIKSYYNKIINEILLAPGIEQFDKIIICGGSGVINSLKINNNSSKIQIKTLSNNDYQKELNSCSHVILSSGLGNFIESVWRNKDIMYIPPVNYSQLLQLDYYKTLDLGFEIVNWDVFDFFIEVPKLLDENTGVDMVIGNVKKYLNSKDDVILKTTTAFFNTSQKDYYPKRNNYINQFEDNSSQKVAEIIIKESR